MLNKILKLIFCLFIFSSPAYSVVDESLDEVKKTKLKHYQGEILADEIIKLDDTIDGDTVEGVDFFDDDKLDFKLFTEYTFAKRRVLNLKMALLMNFQGN